MSTQARSALVEGVDWQAALAGVLDQAADVGAGTGGVDLAFLFASAAYGDDLDALARRARSETGAGVLIGCSGLGIIGPAREVEGEPAVSLLSLSLPGALLWRLRLNQRDLETYQSAEAWHAAAGSGPDEVNAWFVFADPFRLDVEALVNGLSAAYPKVPLIGGLASGDPGARRTFVFLDEHAYDDGAVAVALGGAYTIRTVVSQGAEPLGEPWTITGVKGHLVQTIGQRPALEVLREALRALPPDQLRRAQRNLLVGLAMDEYRDRFQRGDFLIRNLGGVDPASGALAIGAHPRLGQTIQFQLRDARAADEELHELLTREKAALGETEPLAAILCSCNGRGRGLFGRPDHDVGALAEQLGVSDVAGFFCNGEIGPVGRQNYLHGYTASIALIVPKG